MYPPNDRKSSCPSQYDHTTRKMTDENHEMAATFMTCRRGTNVGGSAGQWLFDICGREEQRDGTEPPTPGCVHRVHFLEEIVKLLPSTSVSFGKSLVSIEKADEDMLVMRHVPDQRCN
jgi:hypothetical protein